jgi:hypothetical protein
LFYFGVKLGQPHWRRSVNTFQNRVAWILGPKRDDRMGEWRRLHETLHALYLSPNVICVIKSRQLGWAGHVACMGWGKVHVRFWWGNLKETTWPRHGGRIILIWIFKKWVGGCGLDWSGSGKIGGKLLQMR